LNAPGIKFDSAWIFETHETLAGFGEIKFMLQTQSHKYMVQLDALRAFAIIGVLFHHFLPTSKIATWGSGYFGVRLFFVLSGYLITLILLKCRGFVEEKGQSVSFTLKQFYIRRFLRIFPVFYLVLFASFLLGHQEVQENFWWHFAYGSNFLFALQGFWGESTAHFWSLAVEEQFYIIWPVLIIYTPKRYLFKLIIALIASGPIFRSLVLFSEMNSIAMETVIFSSADSLGMGALFAYASHKPILKEKLVFWGQWMVPVVVIWYFMGGNNFNHLIDWIVIDPIRALAFVWLIDRAGHGFGGLVGRMLEFKPLVYLGKISYGVYVYHLFMPIVLESILGYLEMPLPESEAGQFILLVFATLAVAIPSWHFFEKPINNLKKGFGYKKENQDVMEENKMLLRAES
jgi:peptidoglycan/LPS O-acetylase OafA/YrhL